MPANAYCFTTHWHIPAATEPIFDLLSAAEDLPRWWPAVYLDVKQTEPGDSNGLGGVFALYTKGWLPYRLRWSFRVTENNRPTRLALEAWGDFDGSGVWTLAENDRGTNVTYDWNIAAEKPILRRLSFPLKPVFSANHRWAMARGEESLRAELARRAELTA